MNRPTCAVMSGLLCAMLAACAATATAPAPSTPAVVTVPAAPAAPSVNVPTATPDAKVLGAWRIEQARSAPLIDKRAARVDFGPDGRLSGYTSCNSMSASYTLSGDKLQIGRIATTRKACSDALMEQEDRVLTALERAARATVPPHGFLTIQDAEGAVLMRASRLDASNSAQ